MFKPRPCGCKGVRTCLICEEEFGIMKPKRHQGEDRIISCDGGVDDERSDKEVVYEYCHLCDKAWRSSDTGSAVAKEHPDHSTSTDFTDKDAQTPAVIEFPGILLVPDFLTEPEEEALVTGCDSLPWDLSQSGRRKQNFGPKTNFKKRKIKAGFFAGFPEFSRFAQEKLTAVSLLAGFQTIEQCAIEYRPETGAHIDPHIDDCWVWGERVISLNLLSDSVLTMTPYQYPSVGKPRYNLEYFKNGSLLARSPEVANINVVVRIPMPRRSLLVLYGAARYEWEHAVLRRDISARRICLAYREFTELYLPFGEEYEDGDGMGAEITQRAKQFW